MDSVQNVIKNQLRHNFIAWSLVSSFNEITANNKKRTVDAANSLEMFTHSFWMNTCIQTSKPMQHCRQTGCSLHFINYLFLPCYPIKLIKHVEKCISEIQMFSVCMKNLLPTFHWNYWELVCAETSHIKI